MKKMILPLMCLILGISSAFVASACTFSGNIQELVGTYYCWYGGRGGYALHQDNYITIYDNYKCDYDFPFLAAEGWETEDTHGKCNVVYNGKRLNINMPFFSKHNSYFTDGMIVLRGYYFCKEGIVPYETTDGVKYAAYSDNNSAVLGCEGKDVTIKGNYNDLPVIILSEALCGIDGLESVTVEEGVQMIEYRAFADNELLRKAVLPDSVTTIDVGAFQMCPNLTSVTLGKITALSNGMFFGCTSLETIDIPDTVTKIETAAFDRCESLDTVKMPVSVMEIGDAFHNCGEFVIEYAGTIDQWNAVAKTETWDTGSVVTVKCSGGEEGE